jgi:hypothetical protein
MKDEYLEKTPTRRQQNIYSACFIAACIAIMFLCDSEWAISVFKWIAI